MKTNQRLKAYLLICVLIITTVAGLTACGVKITSITPEETEYTFSINETADLPECVLEPSDADVSKLKFEVENQDIAKIEDGKIVALRSGSTKIIISSKNSSVTADVPITVDLPAGYTKYSNSSYNLIYPSIGYSVTNSLGMVQITSTNTNFNFNFNLVSEPKTSVYNNMTAESYKSMLEEQLQAINFDATVSNVVKGSQTAENISYITFSNQMSYGSIILYQTAYIMSRGAKTYTLTFTRESTVNTATVNGIINTVLSDFYPL